MKILGLHAFYFGQAAALVDEGRVRFFIENEKVSRVKRSRDDFPAAAVQAALRDAGLSPADIDEVAIPKNPWAFARTAVREGAADFFRSIMPRRGPAFSLLPDRLIVTARQMPYFFGHLVRQELTLAGFGPRLPRVHFVPHHLSHAASTFDLSGFPSAAVLVMDGLGDTETTSLWRGEAGRLTRLDAVSFPNSLGEFYAAFTEYCGFRSYEEEGKLMGLAAYGRLDRGLEEKMDRVLAVGDEAYRLDPRFTIRGAHRESLGYSDELCALFGPARRRGAPLDDRVKNIAFAAQDRLERAALAMVRRAVRLSGLRRLCLAGGVAMNCKLNGVIERSGLVDDIFAMPASNDAGAALGAALVRARAHGADPAFPLRHAYFGPEVTDAEIGDLLRRAELPAEQPADVAERAAALIAEGRVVAICVGRAEFGARSLGARSILADPRDASMRDRVNARVKGREAWRPFAPAILAGHESQYFEKGRTSRYMMKAYPVRPEKKAELAAVVHVDGTCRPQSVEAEANPVFHAIISAFHRRTGVPAVLNTSFNFRGEPIVASAADALRCFFSTGIDAMVLGSYWLVKPGVRR